MLVCDWIDLAHDSSLGSEPQVPVEGNNFFTFKAAINFQGRLHTMELHS
jgi:hypothetical protein